MEGETNEMMIMIGGSSFRKGETSYRLSHAYDGTTQLPCPPHRGHGDTGTRYRNEGKGIMTCSVKISMLGGWKEKEMEREKERDKERKGEREERDILVQIFSHPP